jgi:hypothetical protein
VWRPGKDSGRAVTCVPWKEFRDARANTVCARKDSGRANRCVARKGFRADERGCARKGFRAERIAAKELVIYAPSQIVYLCLDGRLCSGRTEARADLMVRLGGITDDGKLCGWIGRWPRASVLRGLLEARRV